MTMIQCHDCTSSTRMRAPHKCWQMADDFAADRDPDRETLLTVDLPSCDGNAHKEEAEHNE